VYDGGSRAVMGLRPAPGLRRYSRLSGLVVSATQMVIYVLKGHGFTGCGKTQFLKRSEKWIAPGCPWNDPWRLVDGFASPNFLPFAIHSEFFRSL
jgi:hypothetical protein